MHECCEARQTAEVELERLRTMTGMADAAGTRILDERNEALSAIERVRAVCDAVTYKVPGDFDSYGPYPEGRNDLAGEVLASLAERETA